MGFKNDLLEMGVGDRWLVGSDIFTETPIAGRETKAVYGAPTANTAMTVVNGSGDTITARVGGQTYPWVVTTTVAATGYSFIYLY